LLFWSGHHYSLDGIVMFEYAKALLFQHSFVMEPPVVWGGTYHVSVWPIGQSLFYIPILALLSTTTSGLEPGLRQVLYLAGEPYYHPLLDNPAYTWASLAIPMLTAATAGLVYILGIQSGLSSRKAAAAALVWGLASPAAVYARFDYAQPLASCMLLLAVVLAIQSVWKTYPALLLAGLVMGLAILTRPETVLYGSPALLAVAIFTPARMAQTTRRNWVQPVIALLLLIGALVLVNQLINAQRFGSLLATGYQASNRDTFLLKPAHMATGLSGNLVSPGRGILLFFPVSLLGSWGFWRIKQRSRLIALVLASIPGLALLLYSAWGQWGAGMTWGPRFLIPVLPYITILTFWGLQLPERLPAWIRSGLPAGLVLAGWIVSLQGQLFDFLSFYGSYHLTDAELMVGNYNFGWQYSPLIGGWKWGISQRSLDIYWRKGLVHGSLGTIFIVSVIVLALAVAAIYWWKYFQAAAGSR
jgi:hypothetical protein